MSPLSVAEDWNTIRQRGYLIVAVKDNLRPLGFRDAQGQLQGLEIEIAQQLSQELLGKPNSVLLKPVPNQERISSLLDGQVDLVIARMTATAPRSRLVTFSLPYYLDSTAIVTRDPTVRQLSDLAGQPVVVLSRSSTADVLRYRFPTAKIVEAESYVDAKAILERGAAIAFAADASVLSGWVQEFPQYRLFAASLSVEPLCIVLPKGLRYDELRQRINEILSRWHSEGWLQQRATYWKLP